MDLTWHIAGPYSTKLLADYGADVIKIEKPGEGDPARRMGPFFQDDPHLEKSGFFLHLNTNKKSITLNLKSEAGKVIFKELVKDVDIVVESFRPGVMALHCRNRTGKGQFFPIAQAETFMPQLGEAIMDFVMNRRVHERIGNRDIRGAIQGCYRSKGEDHWVNITISSEEEWQGFCRALGNPNWAKDPKFSDLLSRYRNHDELDRLIEGWTSQHDHYAIMHMLQKEGVPAAPVMDERDVLSDPHLRERSFFQEITQQECGTHPYPGLAWRMSKTPNRLRLPPVLLGEHNEYVYKQLLGVSDNEYAELQEEGHIGIDFAPEIP